jgi:hypothetical protein
VQPHLASDEFALRCREGEGQGGRWAVHVAILPRGRPQCAVEPRRRHLLPERACGRPAATSSVRLPRRGGGRSLQGGVRDIRSGWRSPGRRAHPGTQPPAPARARSPAGRQDVSALAPNLTTLGEGRVLLT